MELQVANIAAYLGCGLAMGLGAIGSGWGIGYSVVGAARGMARQPSYAGLFRTMLIGQAAASTPSIFAFVISLVLFINYGQGTLAAPDSYAQAAAYIAAGLCIGFGSFGSGAGNGIVASDALEGIARTPSQDSTITVMMLVAQALGQTPVLFAFVVSLILLGDIPGVRQFGVGDEFYQACRMLGAGLCMGLGAVGPGIGSSQAGGMYCRSLADSPKQASVLRNTYLVGASISQSTSLYAFVVALVLLFMADIKIGA